MAAQILILNKIVELSMQEESLINSEDYDDTPNLAAVATYMRHDLHRNQGVFENILPLYSIHEFTSNFRMTRGTLEATYH